MAFLALRRLRSSSMRVRGEERVRRRDATKAWRVVVIIYCESVSILAYVCNFAGYRNQRVNSRTSFCSSLSVVFSLFLFLCKALSDGTKVLPASSRHLTSSSWILRLDTAYGIYL